MVFYVGMQDYVNKISEIISDGLTLIEEGKAMYLGSINCINRHLLASGETKEKAEMFIKDNFSVDLTDFHDASIEFENFWGMLENKVIEDQVKVVLTKPEARIPKGVKATFSETTMASLKNNCDDFLDSYTKKVSDYYVKISEVADMIEDVSMPVVGFEYWQLADVITDNLTVSVICASEGVDLSLNKLGMLSYDQDSDSFDQE